MERTILGGDLWDHQGTHWFRKVVVAKFMNYKGSDNPLLVTETLQARSQCDYQLQDYPNDKQLCDIIVQITNIRTDALILSSSSRVRSCPIRVQQYEVVECDLQYLPDTNNFTLRLELRRQRMHFIWTMYLPSALLLGLGYGTLFLPAEFFSERGAMSLTTLLVFISLYTETSSTLPSTSYIKRIDIWFVFSIVYLTLIIMLHLVTCTSALVAASSSPSSLFSRPLVSPVPSSSGTAGASVRDRKQFSRDRLVLRAAQDKRQKILAAISQAHLILVDGIVTDQMRTRHAVVMEMGILLLGMVILQYK
ncbi:pH-sensitive chloride channel 2-like [Penaeus vannamei]|uniref:pH-sensitive chloride channel 2-like n=1 Tax=Penaeus vannamei TaxID=6689 RepID=UPI00387F9260